MRAERTSEGAGDAAPIRLPLVSVVITNFNYGRFLEQAAGSALEQTYRRIEVVIVDDGSTDDSKEALARIAAAHPAVVIIENARNSGQTYSFWQGLARSRGDYVLFLDADDILLPEAVATHICTHLSSRFHAGFTSCDYVEIKDSTLLTGASMPSLPEAERIRSFGSLGPLMRMIGSEEAARLGLPPEELEKIAAGAAFIHPAVTESKFFAPTSGNCFRRDALELFLDDEAPMSLRLNADVYIREAVYALSGCLLIDRPLFAYRIHGRNGFTHAAGLFGRSCADGAKDLESRKIANRAIAARLLERRAQFLQMFGERNYLLAFRAVLEDVKRHSASDLAEFVQFLTARIDADARKRPGDGFDEKLLALVKRRARPSRALKHLAELVLTAGRLAHSKRLSRLGENWWNAV